MTREEAKDYIREWCPYDRQEEIIKALEQETCDKCVYSTKDGCCQYYDITETIPPFEPCDCISRNKVLEGKVIHQSCDGVEIINGYAVPVEYIEQLPSIQPKPMTGHWTMSDDGLYRPICDNCGAHPWKGYIPTLEEATEVFKYCPNCGAKMESEDKNE